MLTLSFFAEKGADSIIKRVGNNSLDIRIERLNTTSVNYTVMNKDTVRNTMTFLLNLTDPKDISSATVRNNFESFVFRSLIDFKLK